MVQGETVTAFKPTPSGGPLRSSAAPECAIRVHDRGPVREIVLDRRHRRNALTIGMCDALTYALREAAENERTDVVILGSAGGAFCVGSDCDVGDVRAFARAVAEYALALASFPKPLLAAISGLAAGIGAATLLHCDFVIAAESAGIEFSSVKSALLPDAGVSVLLPARVGSALACELLLLGERIDSKTALRLGLVNAVVTLDLEGSVRARAEALSRLPGEAVRGTKRLLRDPMRAALTAAILRELETASSGLPAK